MQVGRTTTVVIAATVTAIAIAIAVGFVISSILPRRDRPEDQLDFPIVWSTSPDELADGVKLDATGKAYFIDIAIGEVGSNEGRPCVVGNSKRTGEGTWEIDGNGAVRIHEGGLTAVLVPIAGRFGGKVDWSIVQEVQCDGTVVEYAYLAPN